VRKQNADGLAVGTLSAAQRANYEIMAMGIHWPDIDEDLSIAGMLKGRRAI
jgi:hypothetical protein